jgi:hypothetical protein
LWIFTLRKLFEKQTAPQVFLWIYAVNKPGGVLDDSKHETAPCSWMWIYNFRQELSSAFLSTPETLLNLLLWIFTLRKLFQKQTAPQVFLWCR